MSLTKKQVAEFAFDIQNGVGRTDIPDFDILRNVGMAASLAVHIRGLGEIDYEVLRKVSDHYFDIHSFALPNVLTILAELEFIQLITSTTKIKKVIPQVPKFQDIYEIIGNYPNLGDFNEHEQAILAILGELYKKPDNKDRLLNTIGIEPEVFNRCLTIGSTGGFIREHRAREKTILVSPYYFADNLNSLADIVAKNGASEIEKVLNFIRNHQGWPLSLIEQQSEIGGIKLNNLQKSLITTLASEGVLKPPTITFSNRTESFIFTPHPGSSRLNASNRETYERAMALVSSVRKGQLLPDLYKIRSPLQILEALKNKGYLKSNSEANVQYKNLVVLKVAYLKQIGNSRWQLHLHETQENLDALNLAINILRTGEISNMEVNQEARIALSKDEKYIQSIIASKELRVRKKQEIDEQTALEFEKLILSY
ncbi:hypothetical protein [Nostoc sp. ChiSLP03a]|uniref:hypothetical protein n=1 Tax=Nostoc sp. ChiSLP03a TaxID=3075380 RepID=UPI002AD51CC7|nr:hypothetical protein [Nostoc sp. ChiSLP03a]MDZ8213002.1 hypothetical protein [Nostoc sp. ChiSLP03a]